MKKTLTIILNILSLLLVIQSMDGFHALAMFLLVGEIPGTNITISATVCLEFFALLIGFVIARIGIHLARSINLTQPLR